MHLYRQRNIQVSPFTKYYTRLFANEFNSPDRIKQTSIDKKCTEVVIIGTGQWDSTGWPKHHPTPFSDYEKILNSSIPTTLKMFYDANIDDYLFNAVGFSPYCGTQSIDCSTLLFFYSLFITHSGTNIL